MSLGPNGPQRRAHSACGLKSSACPSTPGGLMTNDDSIEPKTRALLDNRVKVQFTDEQIALLAQRHEALGLTASAYVRSLVLRDLEIASVRDALSARKASKHASMLNVAELHTLAMQVKKLGTNVNQLAKQANAAMVPITRAEVIYMLNQHQLLMSKAIATVEKLLA